LSLLGRLEDLSLPDIIQIVFLSRRTGILEIIDGQGRHTVLFHHGLIVNASSPDAPDLATFLQQGGYVDAARLAPLRKMEDVGIPLGTALLEMNVMDRDALAQMVTDRITGVVVPLLTSRDGEFNFILSDSVGQLDIEYEPATLFKEGGVSPQKLLGGADGEKLKPLRGLEESMKAGKALLRGAPVASAAEPEPASAPAIDVETDRVFDALEDTSIEAALPSVGENVFDVAPAVSPNDEESPLSLDEAPEPTPEATADEEPPAPIEAEAPPPKPEKSRVRIEAASELSSVDRNVLLYERSPLLRVAAKRAFTKRGMKIAQYGSIDDLRVAAADLLKRNEYFITFLELSGTSESSDGEAPHLLSLIKRKNHMLPVVLIDREADLRRRSRLLKLGADHYLTKPSEAHLQPALADEQLALFADELVMFAERSFEEFDLLVSGDENRGQQLYEMAERERASRTEDVLKLLISELSNPNDVSELTATILRLSEEYFDRTLLFVGHDRHFIGVGGASTSDVDGQMNDRVRKIRISYAEPSVLADVAATGEPHRGKIRRTDANETLIRSLGAKLPTEVVVLPIMNRGHVVGLLYGDNAEQHTPFGDLSGLEMFLSQAGFALENAVTAASRRGDTSWELA
jgi:ActR/RegA family two-component response regulator